MDNLRDQKQLPRVVLNAARAWLADHVLWLLATPTVLIALLGVLGVVAGLDPMDLAVQFLGEVRTDVSVIVVVLGMSHILITTVRFGVRPSLPCSLQHRALSANVIARFTRSVEIWATSSAGMAALFASSHSWRLAPTRLKHKPLVTASDLAGATPRLE